jgi:signal transduction histidine kinase
VDGARETARRTIRDGNRASDVIKRLRALFAKKKAVAEPLDLNEAAREVVAMLLGELQRNGVTLHPDFADDLPPVVGDRVQLQQVILNLILNASDAMTGITDRPRYMTIRTVHDESGCVCLSVRDVGAGFDPQDAGSLFNAFFTTKADGMGIGLSVSRSIIEGHDGRLWAEANEGPGATFTFSIPCLPAKAAVAGPGAPADSNRTTESS